MNTIPHPATVWTEADEEIVHKVRQQKWARITISHYKDHVNYNMTISKARQRQYEAACRILMEHALTK